MVAERLVAGVCVCVITCDLHCSTATAEKRGRKREWGEEGKEGEGGREGEGGGIRRERGRIKRIVTRRWVASWVRQCVCWWSPEVQSTRHFFLMVQAAVTPTSVFPAPEGGEWEKGGGRVRGGRR